VDRRDFLKHSGALAAALAGSGQVRAAGQPAAHRAAAAPLARGDLALVNARIVTVDPSRPRAEAVLVRAGRIAHVGTSAEVKAKSGDAPLFDAGGRTVVPGFIDAHTHMEVAVSHQMYAVDVHAAKTTRELQNMLAAKASKTAPGAWVIGRAGFGLENTLAEKKLPNRQDLDEASQDHPVIVFSGRHISMLNSRALKAFGMWESTAKPPMGTTIHRDQGGVPTGLATEVFYFLPEFSVDEMKAAIRGQAKQLFTDRGTTTIFTIPFSAQDVRADIELQRAGELPLRVRMFYHVPHMTSLEGLLNMGYPSGVGDDMFRFGGMKLFVDGTGSDALGNRYDDVKWTQEELNHLLSSADAAGIQTILHLVTDGGLKMAVAAIEETRRRNPKQPYLVHRIEHGGDRGGIELVRHLRDLGIRLSITPGRGRQGATRPRYQTLVQEQSDPILITDTTGTTPGSSDILFKVACAAVSVDQGGGAPKGEELGFEGALRLFTIGNARCGYEEGEKGSIAVGKLADFAVLSGDPTAMAAKSLFDLKVDATILGGDVVFQR
jgi:predicted amidohydrolase YtcJ